MVEVNTTQSNNQFVTKVLKDNNGSVYGAEVLLFDVDDKIIDKIHITNESEFQSWTTVIENMKDAYVPYTEEDKNNLEELKSLRATYESSGDDEDWSAYQQFLDDLENGGWSYLKRLGTLEDILRNDIDTATNNYPVTINATQFNGMDSDMFSKVGHTHNFASLNHAVSTSVNGVGTNKLYGHVKVINNLTRNSYVNGESLSAYQGKVLKTEIDNLKNKNSWIGVQSIGDYIKYDVNPDLKLVVFYYNRSNFTGLSDTTGTHIIHPKVIPENYRPGTRVHTTMYRGDVVLLFDSNGDIGIHNLNKVSSMNLYAQVMWHYI